MTRRLIVLPAARLELIAAQDWYVQVSVSLGHAFRAQIDHEVSRILDNPRQFPVVLHDIRRARLRRFPYGLFFHERAEGIVLVACFHGSRDPVAWRSRV